MKFRKTALLVLVGILLFAFAAAMAQTPAQSDQKEKTEACCAMESCCCCSGDSCDMKKHDGKQHDGKAECCNMKSKAKKKAA